MSCPGSSFDIEDTVDSYFDVGLDEAAARYEETHGIDDDDNDVYDDEIPTQCAVSAEPSPGIAPNRAPPTRRVENPAVTETGVRSSGRLKRPNARYN
jgi:hypothetical protein